MRQLPTCPNRPIRAALLRLSAVLGLAASCMACDEKEPMKTPIRDPNVPHYSKLGYDVTPLAKEQLAPLVLKLTPEQREVTQDHGTEPRFCGGLLHNADSGFYGCVVCGLPLFKSSAKFDSGTGWPSFFEPFDPEHVLSIEDRSYGMVRVEVRCARCSSHLGHVFDDGPRPTGLRFCMNSAALRFVKDGDPVPAESRPAELETAYFAGGCFWGVEDVFQQIPGVIDAESGYMGGDVEQPSYKLVCSESTGHAETVKVVFDARRVPYRDLLDVFFKNHDPTTVDRQGPDVGSQYRSAVFTTSDAQRQQALALIAELQQLPEYARQPIVTQVASAPRFWPAEDYHQDYHKKHGGSCRVKR